MWTRQLLKQNGKIAFQRNYWTCVLVGIIANFFLGGTGISLNNSTSEQETIQGYDSVESLQGLIDQIPDTFIMIAALVTLVVALLGICFGILVSNVIQVGCNRFFMENREHKTNVGQMFYSFREGRYGSTVWIMFLKGLYILGWTLLFLIPGIIKSYAYLMVPYIIAENPYMDRRRVFELSEQMMDGHKMEAFTLALSFFGWHLLGVMTAGIVSTFYATPYQYATFAEFYTALKAEALQRGILVPGELPGVSMQQETAPEF